MSQEEWRWGSSAGEQVGEGQEGGCEGSQGNLLFLRCFFLVLRHTPGTPGTGFTSLLLTGGGCRMGLGARVRHTGSPAAHSRIPVIPGGGGADIVRRGGVMRSHALPISFR